MWSISNTVWDSSHSSKTLHHSVKQVCKDQTPTFWNLRLIRFFIAFCDFLSASFHLFARTDHKTRNTGTTGTFAAHNPAVKRRHGSWRSAALISSLHRTPQLPFGGFQMFSSEDRLGPNHVCCDPHWICRLTVLTSLTSASLLFFI